MSLRRLALLAVALAVSAALALAQTRAGGDGPLTILVSFDGWRWDYDTKAPAPALRALIARGVRAQALVPSFPSKTTWFPLTVGLGSLARLRRCSSEGNRVRPNLDQPLTPSRR